MRIQKINGSNSDASTTRPTNEDLQDPSTSLFDQDLAFRLSGAEGLKADCVGNTGELRKLDAAYSFFSVDDLIAEKSSQAANILRFMSRWVEEENGSHFRIGKLP